MSEGLVVILSGACSVGKKEIANLLLNDPDLKLMKSISMTTRPPKANEVDGKDYYFVDFKDFANAVKQQDLLEYTEFNGWYYGTPKNAVDFLRHNGKNVLIMVEAQGVGPIKMAIPDALAFFVMPKSLEELEANIQEMFQDDQASAARRISKAKMDMELAPLFRNVVTNENAQVAYETIKEKIMEPMNQTKEEA